MKGKNNKPPPHPLHSPLLNSHAAARQLQLHPSSHSIMFQTTGCLRLPKYFLLFFWRGWGVGWGESSLVLFLSLHSLPSVSSSSSSLSSHPLHLGSWSVSGVTGMSWLPLSLSQLVDLSYRLLRSWVPSFPLGLTHTDTWNGAPLPPVSCSPFCNLPQNQKWACPDVQIHMYGHASLCVPK